jgi:hypothetical protein
VGLLVRFDMSRVVALLTCLVAYTFLPVAMVIVAFETALDYVRKSLEELR